MRVCYLSNITTAVYHYYMSIDRFVRLDEHAALGHTMLQSIMDGIHGVSDMSGIKLEYEDIKLAKTRFEELCTSVPTQARVIMSAIAALTCLQLIVHRVRRVRMYKEHLKRL